MTATIPAKHRRAVEAFRTLCDLAGVPVTSERYLAVLESLRRGEPVNVRLATLEHEATIWEAEKRLLSEAMRRQSLALLESAGKDGDGAGTGPGAVALLEAMARLTGIRQEAPVVNVTVPLEEMARMAGIKQDPPVVNVHIPEQQQPAINVSLPEMVVHVPAAKSPVIRNVIESAAPPEIVVNVEAPAVTVTPEIKMVVPKTRKKVYRDRKTGQIDEITEEAI